MGFGHWTGGPGPGWEAGQAICTFGGQTRASQKPRRQRPVWNCQSSFAHTASLWSPFQSGQGVTQNCLDILLHPELDWAQ